MKKASGNTRVSKPVFVDRNAELEALELLPPQLRLALQDANIPVNAIDVARAWHQALGTRPRHMLLHEFLQHLRALEADDIGRFAAAYRREWRLPYPHVAAEAAILRGGYA